MFSHLLSINAAWFLRVTTSLNLAAALENTHGFPQEPLTGRAAAARLNAWIQDCAVCPDGFLFFSGRDIRWGGVDMAQTIHVWYISLYIYHKHLPNVDKYNIHGWYGWNP